MDAPAASACGWASVYVSSFLFIMLVTAEFIYAKSVSAPHTPPRSHSRTARSSIPLEPGLRWRPAPFYRRKENGIEVRFWLYQKPDGKIATVLDACEICGSVGFYKGTTGVVCKNCAAPINPQSVGMPGGCNPIPLKAETTADAVIIKEADVAAASRVLPEIAMFARLLYESFRRQKRRKLLAGVAITLGVAVATAMIAVATDIGDKINRELRSYGANLLVTPQEDTIDVEIGGVNLKPPSDGNFLSEADLPKIKGTFWRHNILGFSPMLPVNVTVSARAHAGRNAARDLLRQATRFRQRSVHHRREEHASLVEGRRRLARRTIPGCAGRRASGAQTRTCSAGDAIDDRRAEPSRRRNSLHRRRRR